MNKFQYTLKHKKAFLKVEREIFGYNTLRGYLHDVDKLFLYLFMKKEKAHKLHRKFAKHHLGSATSPDDYMQMIIDWECARITKPDKQLSARDFYDKIQYKLSPRDKKQIEAVLGFIDFNGRLNKIYK